MPPADQKQGRRPDDSGPEWSLALQLAGRSGAGIIFDYCLLLGTPLFCFSAACAGQWADRFREFRPRHAQIAAVAEDLFEEDETVLKAHHIFDYRAAAEVPVSWADQIVATVLDSGVPLQPSDERYLQNIARPDERQASDCGIAEN